MKNVRRGLSCIIILSKASKHVFAFFTCVHRRNASSFLADGDVEVKVVSLWTLAPVEPNVAPFPEPRLSCRASCVLTAGPHFIAFAVPLMRIRVKASNL